MGVKPWVPYVALIGIMVNGALLTPCTAKTSSQLAPKNIQGSILGLFQAMSSFGQFVGPLIGGAIFVRHITSPFWCCICFCLLSAMMAPMIFQEKYDNANILPLLVTEENLDQIPNKKMKRLPTQMELLHGEPLALPPICMNPQFCRIWSIGNDSELKRTLSSPAA